MSKFQLIISQELQDVLIHLKSSYGAQLLLQKEHSGEAFLDEPVNYLSVSNSDKTKISYLSQDRIEKLDPDEIWTTGRRYHGRPASVLQKIFNCDAMGLTNRDLEAFANQYRSYFTGNEIEFKVVSGDLIKKYYLADSYSSNSGSLGNSCMKYDNCQKNFDIYLKNPDIVKMLVMLNCDGYLIGRALLWHFGDNKIMDRIYTTNDEQYSFQFKKWANENGYIYKYEQKWNNTFDFEKEGNKLTSKYEIKLDHWQFDRYPYLDTFKFLDKKTGVLTNYLPDNIDDVKTVCAPDGGYFPGDHLILDFVTNLWCYQGETVYIQYNNGQYIDSERSFLRTHSHNAHWSNINNLHILRSDSLYDEELEDYIFNAELHSLNKNDKIEERREYIRKRNKEYEEAKKKAIKKMSTVDTLRDLTESYFSNPIMFRPRRVNAERETEGQSVQETENGTTESFGSRFDQWVNEMYEMVRPEGVRVEELQNPCVEVQINNTEPQEG